MLESSELLGMVVDRCQILFIRPPIYLCLLDS
jgi:hypothetical protein